MNLRLPSWGSRPRTIGLRLGAFLACAACIGLDVDSGASFPSSADWAASAETIAQEAEPGDALWVLPAYTQLHPDFRATKQGVLDTLPRLVMQNPTVLDVARHRRLWIVAPSSVQFPLPEEVGAVESIAAHGSLQVSRVDLPVRSRKFDLSSALQRADVSRWDASGKSLPCVWRGDRHHCRGGARDQDVRWTWGEVGNTRREAAFVHAGPDGGRLQLSWKDAELGAELYVSLGLGLQAVRREAGGDVRVRISLGGAVLWEERLVPRDFQWHSRRFALDVETSGNLSIEVLAEDARKRDVFVDVVSF
jgi:hypothetical protein